nr:Transposon Ty3-I Gag-Pol polyprotein [Ipomoea batatas]
MAQWEEMGELFIEDEDIEEPCTEEAEIEELYATNDPIGEEPPPKVELKPLPPNLRGETLFILTKLGKDYVPWFADIVNYLVSGYIPKDFSYNKRKRFLHDVRDYFWDEPLLFKRCVDGIVRRCVPEEEFMRRTKSIAKKPAPKVPQLQESKTEIDRDILLSLFKDMRATLGPVGNTRKRARRGAAAQAQQRVEVEEENEEAVERLETRNEAHAYQTWLRGQFPPGPQYYYDPAGGPPHYYDPTGGPPHFYSSAGSSQPYYGAAGGSQYYFDPAEGSQPQYDPSRGPQFPYDPTDF